MIGVDLLCIVLFSHLLTATLMPTAYGRLLGKIVCAFRKETQSVSPDPGEST